MRLEHSVDELARAALTTFVHPAMWEHSMLVWAPNAWYVHARFALNTIAGAGAGDRHQASLCIAQGCKTCFLFQRRGRRRADPASIRINDRGSDGRVRQ